jgi:uracil-DNA glycosylase
MSDHFQQLLNATIEHLHSLRARGAQFVPLQPETLHALNGAVHRNGTTKTEHQAPNIEHRTSNVTPSSALNSQPSTLNTTKAQAIAELRTRAMQCLKCAHLASTRTQVVFGVGNIDAELMFVGEGPGADEDLQGEPFVGLAGQLLTRMIKAMGLAREDVYIANVLKCRPDMPAGSSGNRKPTPEEMQTCIPYLHAQIDLIQPKVLVALGGTAVEGLLGKSGIMKLRGQWQTYRGLPLMPTFHPAYLLRNQAHTEKRKVWEDLMAVMEKLALPISEKQRGYFLK